MLQLVSRAPLGFLMRRSLCRSSTIRLSGLPSLSSATTISGISRDIHDHSSESGNSGEQEKVKTILGISLAKGEVNEGLLNALSLENASKNEKYKVTKLSIVEKFKRKESDTGSPEVQSTIRI